MIKDQQIKEAKNDTTRFSLCCTRCTKPIGPFKFEQRQSRPDDVIIDIEYCGVCHSDLHQARNDWGFSRYPIVPGHEVIGRVKSIGNAVTKFRVGDLVGIGCMVDSCRTCSACHQGLEQ